MKRISLFLLAAIMLLSLVGCGSTDIDPQEENFSFTYNGTKITLGAEAAPIIDALGEPRSYTEEPSCAFDGMDKTYYYGSFYLSTYPLDGKDYVYSIWFADDSVATNDGIRIGSTQIQVEAVYGTECFNGTNSYTEIQSSTKLTILLEENKVTSIQIDLLID
jgi:hypothetical protein